MKMDFYKFFGYLSILNYILWLLELNVVILAVNLPLVIILSVFGMKLWTLPVVFLAGITAGPSVLAAFGAMPHIEDGVIKYYFGCFKRNWKKCLKVWVPVWFLMVFLVADLMILQTYQVMPHLKWVLLFIILAATVFLLTFFMVWAAWEQEGRAAAVLTVKLAFVKPVRFYFNFPILIGTIMLLGMKPVYLLLYGASLGLFLAYKNFQPVIQFVNERPENCTDRLEN